MNSSASIVICVRYCLLLAGCVLHAYEMGAYSNGSADVDSDGHILSLFARWPLLLSYLLGFSGKKWLQHHFLLLVFQACPRSWRYSLIRALPSSLDLCGHSQDCVVIVLRVLLCVLTHISIRVVFTAVRTKMESSNRCIQQ